MEDTEKSNAVCRTSREEERSYENGLRRSVCEKTTKEDFEENFCEFIHVHEEIVDKVEKVMPDEQQLLDLSEFFKVFGDSTRIKILYVLSQSEMCVCDIATLLQMGQSAISHQLRVLKQMRLVSFRREGKTVFYRLADAHIETILAQGMEHIEE